MNSPTQLMYTKSHEWVDFTDETTARIGLTDYAQKALGGIVFVNLPEEGDTLTAGERFGDVESVKAVSDVFSPFDGTVAAINETLLDEPGLINETPYDAWLIEASDIASREELLDAAAYASFCAENE